MKHLLSSFILILLILPLLSQTSISGIINVYGSVSSVSPTGSCETLITVDDSNGFEAGDFALLIQMQGAEINESDSPSFGTLVSLNNAGLYEKVRINSISGNNIYTAGSLINNYTTSGKIQLVSIPQYNDATVTSTIRPMAWDGDKGGIIALEVSGTLTLQDSIHANADGFRGGERNNPSSNCVALLNITNHYFPQGSWQAEGKGESVAQMIVGKEAGKGRQLTGGGGGNDHNAGGGGGAGFGIGGKGGINDAPGFFDCRGSNPGLGGTNIPYANNRIFLGGGGGAGHDNNDAGTNGGNGGGIIYIHANTIQSNGNIISANGGYPGLTVGLDGGGGGGGAGSIMLFVENVLDLTNVELNGGNGSSTNNLMDGRCIGPGGGGGGGIIHTNLSGSDMDAFVLGGNPGIVIQSIESCNGSSNGAESGATGSVYPFFELPFNDGSPLVENINYDGCSGDGFSEVVNGITYDENNPIGMESIVLPDGCDSLVNINLQFISLNITEIISGDNVSINVTGGSAPYSYVWSNGNSGVSNTLNTSGNYTVTVTDSNGCSSIHPFNFIHTSLEEIKYNWDINIYPTLISENLNILRNSTTAEKIQIRIFDLQGKLKYEDILYPNELDKVIQFNNWTKGIYFLNLQDSKYSSTIKISYL